MFSPTPGALVANRFRLRHAIGKGGMGQVWEAHDRELDSPCAVKFIVDHMAQDPEARLRILREARAVARLRSPHVVTILGVGEHADAMYLAMELLEGETLASRLERMGKLDASTTLTLLEQVVLVLDKAHANGIVHRDLKPDNLWLTADPKPFIKLLDFGVAKSTLAVGTSQTASGALMGTPQYMSPEQASGDREVDHRSDLWALAIIAMECLSGRRPFESSGLGDLLMKIMNAAPPVVQVLDPALPASLGPWWQRALARDPNQRFQNGAHLLQGLRSGLSTSPSAAGPVLADTDRGSWMAAPLPPRIPTLVTSITPTPVAAPPATTEPLVLGRFRVVPTPAPAGASVGPVTHTAELTRPVLAGPRRLLLGAGAAALGLGLLALWLARVQAPASPAASAALPAASALPAPPALPAPTPSLQPSAPGPEPAGVDALGAAAVGASAPAAVAAPAPKLPPQRPARARRSARKASAHAATQAPEHTPKDPGAPAQNAKLKARLGF